jgi:hypothetical protein
MSGTTEPLRPEERTSEEELAIVLERRKKLDSERKNARPADEVFRRILEKPKP